MPNLIHPGCFKRLAAILSELEAESEVCGYLQGFQVHNDIYIANCARVDEDYNWENTARKLEQHSSGGVKCVGIFIGVTNDDENLEAKANSFLNARLDDPGFSESIVHERPLVLVASKRGNSTSSALFRCESAGAEMVLAWVTPELYTETNDIFTPSGMVALHCPCKILISVEHSEDEQSLILPESIKAALQHLQVKLQSTGYCFGMENGMVLTDANTGLLEKLTNPKKQSGMSPGKEKKSLLQASGGGPVLELKLLKPSGTSSEASQFAPALVTEESKTRSTIDVLLEGLCFVNPSLSSIGDAVVQVRLSLARQICGFIQTLKDFSPQELAESYELCAKLFKPEQLPLPFVMCYRLKKKEGQVVSNQETEVWLKDFRRRTHKLFLLPMTKPLLKSSFAFSFDQKDAGLKWGKLADVHVGLGSSGVAGGRQYLVQGSYLYYHYLQDNCNDKGWGCAYRSLQTIMSWFKLNYFPEANVPIHSEIQKVLHDIGDKPAAFVGTNGWIGSMEVGFYIDQTLGVEWKNIRVDSGPDLAQKARELASHFDEHGSPVMMGGGTLAFTLLGVDWNEQTGEVMFLILDPHYTGPEELKLIQNKVSSMEGYKATACGWRAASTFSNETFYSLCLPQTPALL